MAEVLPKSQKWQVHFHTRKGWFEKILTKQELFDYYEEITTYGGIRTKNSDGEEGDLLEITKHTVIPM